MDSTFAPFGAWRISQSLSQVIEPSGRNRKVSQHYSQRLLSLRMSRNHYCTNDLELQVSGSGFWFRPTFRLEPLCVRSPPTENARALGTTTPVKNVGKVYSFSLHLPLIQCWGMPRDFNHTILSITNVHQYFNIDMG